MATVGKVTISIASYSQCSPCLSTLLNKDICEACIEKEWFLVERQAGDDCWYNKTQFHEYYGDQCDLLWQKARKRPGGLHPLVRDCEWKKPNRCKVTHAPTIEAEAVSAPIPWQCGRPKGPVIYGGGRKVCRHWWLLAPWSGRRCCWQYCTSTEGAWRVRGDRLSGLLSKASGNASWMRAYLDLLCMSGEVYTLWHMQETSHAFPQDFSPW